MIVRTISTRGICETLGVSRDWVNKHLRPMGGAVPDIRRKRADVRTIFYERQDILRWLNANARYSRQTYLIDLTDYAKATDIGLMMAAIDSVPDLSQRREIVREFMETHLPEELYRGVQMVDERNRGWLNWAPVNHHIDTLDQLHTMKQLMEEWGHRSQELTYRTIFLKAMIRVEIDGRVWFMDAPEKDIKHPLQLPISPAIEL